MNGYDILILGSLAFAIVGLALDKLLDVYILARKQLKKMAKKANKKEVILVGKTWRK